MSFSPGDFGFEEMNSAGDLGGGKNDFQRVSQCLSSNITKIAQNTAAIQRMVNQLGTSEDSSQITEDLQQTTHYNNQLASESRDFLQKISGLKSSSASEQREWKIQRERLLGSFTDALKDFQSIQRLAAQREKECVQRARTQSNSGNPFEENRDNTLIEFDPSPADPSNVQQQQQVNDQQINIELIEERESALKQLEADIMDVNQIFKDVAGMVHEQGEVIDSIESNVEKTEVRTQQANSQLRKAADSQRSYRKKCFIFIIVLIVVLAVLGLIIGLSVN